MNRLTRTQQKVQKRSTKAIILMFGFLIVIVIVFVIFGIPMLINFSLFLEKIRTGGEDNIKTSSMIPSYVAPPMLNPMPVATNSAQVIISGYSLPAYTVQLYVNDRLVQSEKIASKKSFTFRNVSLREGKNEIKAKTVTEEGKESIYSEKITILFIAKAPSLAIDSPSDEQSFQGSDNQIKVTGKTEANVKVTVNDFWAIVDDEGKFSYLLPLQKGENRLKITATDPAGNQTTKELKVTLND